MTNLWPWASAVLMLVGCSAVTDFGRYYGRDGGGGTDSGTCDAPSIETCNGMDDDCDGVADEDFDLDTDPNNCGECGAVCADPDRATASCVSGECAASCDAGYADCDGDIANGCEADVNDPATCGGCDTACDAGLFCDAGSCVSDCGADLTECDGSCVDLNVSIAHCGGCGRACPDLAGSTPMCAGGVCEAECAAGAGDCDGDAGNGCEADLTSPASCGACGNACMFTNAAPLCIGGSCALGACASGFADCDGVPVNGCETDLSQPSNCGSCGIFCPVATPVCTPGGCDTGCSSAALTLCSGSCVDTSNHVDNCGGCDIACLARPNATRTCVSSTCATSCISGYGDCDANPVNGCEADLRRPSSCGSCTRTCSVSNGAPGCTSGACTVASCRSGFADCDLSYASGCEADLTSSIANCGACGGSCWLECDASACDEAILIEAGGGSCVIQSSGAVACWGANADGQIGDGTVNQKLRPTHSMISSVVDISSGREHTCAAKSDFTAWCWGENVYGQLGDGSGSLESSTPVRVSTLGTASTRVVQVGAGDNFSCARTSVGAVYCWGANNLGQLGNGSTSTTPTLTPALVSLSTRAASDLALGRQHACIVTTTAQVMCWGHNINGQLGLGNNTISFNTPQVNSINAAAGVTAGAFHTCAVRMSGEVRCWGNNMQGQIGDGTTTARWSPVVVAAGGVTFAEVSAGYQHTCARTLGGNIHCWGDNSSGQVGNGGGANRLVPTLIGANFAELAAGRYHSCARDRTDRLFCWGSNSGGGLGDGTLMFRTTPTPVVNIPPPP